MKKGSSAHVRIIDRDLTAVLLEELRDVFLEGQSHLLPQLVRFRGPVDRREIVRGQVRRRTEQPSPMVSEREDCRTPASRQATVRSRIFRIRVREREREDSRTFCFDSEPPQIPFDASRNVSVRRELVKALSRACRDSKREHGCTSFRELSRHGAFVSALDATEREMRAVTDQASRRKRARSVPLERRVQLRQSESTLTRWFERERRSQGQNQNVETYRARACPSRSCREELSRYAGAGEIERR